MPITYRIDHSRKLIVAAGYGTLTDQDVFGYERETVALEGIVGYDELLDMTHVTQLDVTSVDRVQELANLAASKDVPTAKSRIAVVAPTDVLYGLGRMFQTYRELVPGNVKQVRIFRTMAEALKFLNLESPDVAIKAEDKSRDASTGPGNPSGCGCH